MLVCLQLRPNSRCVQRSACFSGSAIYGPAIAKRGWLFMAPDLRCAHSFWKPRELKAMNIPGLDAGVATTRSKLSSRGLQRKHVVGIACVDPAMQARGCRE
jgi:hypothetical protein